MSTCRDVAESLYDLTAGEVPPERRKGLEEHLGYCPPCAALVQSYQLTVRLGRRLPPAPMPPRALARLRQALDAGPGAAPPAPA